MLKDMDAMMFFSGIHLRGRFRKLSTSHPTNWQVKSLTPNTMLDFVSQQFIGQYI
jgi:hypothetical protein